MSDPSANLSTMDGNAVVNRAAVVIGAGIGGLAAAQVLSRRYASVTVLDRDTLPAGGEPRRGVPQGPHGHILLLAGLRALSGLFPGLADELVASGASRFDVGSGLCVHRFGRRRAAAPLGLELLSVSRPQLEALIRGRVAREPRVTFRAGAAVTGLAGSAEQVTGVVLDTGETVPADLVVDCSGRAGHSDRWLTDLGLPAPRQVEIKVGVAYASRIYRRRPGELEGWQAAMVVPAPPHEQRIGVVLPIEGDRWLVSVGGWHVDQVPSDVASVEAYARSLPDPIVAELMAEAEPLTDPVPYRFAASRRRYFEELERLPAGYLALGDTICSFNPIYGQGMSVAAMEAVALGTTLERHGAATAETAADYYRATAELLAVPWQFAAGGDFAYPQTSGPRPRGNRLTNWYVRRLITVAQSVPELNRAFYEVQHLVAPPKRLLRPSVVAKVLLGR